MEERDKHEEKVLWRQRATYNTRGKRWLFKLAKLLSSKRLTRFAIRRSLKVETLIGRDEDWANWY